MEETGMQIGIIKLEQFLTIQIKYQENTVSHGQEVELTTTCLI